MSIQLPGKVLKWLTVFLHHAAEVCETFLELDVFAARITNVYYFKRQASKHLYIGLVSKA